MITWLVGLVAVWNTSAIYAEQQLTQPPRFSVHSLNLTVHRDGKFQGIIEITNKNGPDLSLWDHHSGYGEYAYRLEFLNSTTRKHYVIIRSPLDRTMNLTKKIKLSRGDTISIGFDLNDGSWLLPPDFSEKLEGLQVRAWYKPGAIAGETMRAGQMSVTLDCFVGEFNDWIKAIITKETGGKESPHDKTHTTPVKQ